MPGTPSTITRGALILGFLTFLFLAASPLAAQDAEGNVMLKVEDIPWGTPSSGVSMAPLYGSPGAEGEMFAFRLTVPDGWEMRPHTHPVAEHVTVISGRLYVGWGRTMDREAATSFDAGSYVVIGADVPAYMWAEGETVLQAHGVGPLRTDMIEPGNP